MLVCLNSPLQIPWALVAQSGRRHNVSRKPFSSRPTARSTGWSFVTKPPNTKLGGSCPTSKSALISHLRLISSRRRLLNDPRRGLRGGTLRTQASSDYILRHSARHSSPFSLRGFRARINSSAPRQLHCALATSTGEGLQTVCINTSVNDLRVT